MAISVRLFAQRTTRDWSGGPVDRGLCALSQHESFERGLRGLRSGRCVRGSIRRELRDDNIALAGRLREVHDMVDELRDIATASLVENWIDEAERRTSFLFESCRRAD
jgi:hypothetical protein